MKTHRCEKSLKAGLSIRYTKEFPVSWDIEDDKETWRLFHQTSDSEYGNIKCHVSEIEFRPCCGLNLKESDD